MAYPETWVILSCTNTLTQCSKCGDVFDFYEGHEECGKIDADYQWLFSEGAYGV